MVGAIRLERCADNARYTRAASSESAMLRPGDRTGLVERRHGVDEPSLGQVTRRGPLPVDTLAGDLADFRRAVPLAQLGEQPAALDAGELAVIAGEDHLGAGLLRFRQQLAGDPAVSIAASSTTTTVRRSQLVRPFFKPNSAECTVPASLNPSAFRSCATGVRRQADHPLPGAPHATRGAQSTDLGRAVGKGSLRSQPRKVQHSVSKRLYSLRSRIECFIGHLKEQRRIATRYDKTATSFLGFVLLGCIRLWIRFVHRA